MGTEAWQGKDKNSVPKLNSLGGANGEGGSFVVDGNVFAFQEMARGVAP